MISSLILAGGNGNRFGGTTPKQYAILGDKPVLLHSLDKMLHWERNEEIRIVISKEFRNQIPIDSSNKKILLFDPGKTRHDSFLSGVSGRRWNHKDVIFVHDAARPFFKISDLELLYEGAVSHGISSLYSILTETILEDNAQGVCVRNRDTLRSIKTPQAIRGDLLEAWQNKEFLRSPTDLTTWGLENGITPSLVETGTWNLKITHAEDLIVANALLASVVEV
jgi:2-C-methyl-D-erythritol 4-phosphate cytidylyltransferase